MKKIAVGDLGEFWYGDYKEPFEQLEGGVPGHPVGVVLKADDGKVLCAYCGKTYHHLGTHVWQAHGMTAKAYKAEVGLLQKSALVSERVRLTRTRIAQRINSPFFQPGRVMSDASQARAQATRRDGRMKQAVWLPERLNKTGRCYKQVVAVARTISAGGHRVTQEALSKRGIGPQTVRTYFGTIADLRDMLGQPRTLRQDGWTEREMVAAFRNLGLELGHTPTRSDCRRYGLSEGVISRLGGYSAVATKAGLEPNLPIPDSHDLDQQVLVAYATYGDVRKAGASLHIDAPRVSSVLAKYGCPFPPYVGAANRQRREWAAEMARRLAGVEDQAA